MQIHLVEWSYNSKILLHYARIQDIIDRAGWSPAQTFNTFYKREIISPDANSFGRVVLQQ